MKMNTTSVKRVASLAMACCLVGGLAWTAYGAAPKESALTLWYERPAAHWHGQALPLGNGSLGCMVFGGVDKEQLQFNVDSLWTGDENMVGKERGVSKDASYLAPGMGFYQNFGSVHIALEGGGEVTDYRRELDLSRAVHTVSYTRGGVRFTRETFCSFPAKVAVMHLTANAPGQYSGTISLEDAHEAKTAAEGLRLTAAGALDNGVQYESQLRVLAEGGEITPEDGVLRFKDCDALLLVLAADTNYVMDPARHWKGEHPHRRVAERVNAVAAGDYGRLIERHIADHQSLFGRVAIDLGSTDAAQADLPTDQRIQAYRDDAADPELEALLFQYGRYLLIACSRPGSLPANLQGVWNNSNQPPWHCDYHTNINVQMNYWLAEPANLGECQLPLFDLFTAAVPLHRKASLIRFGETPGFTMQTVNNIFGGTGWEWNMVGSAWLAQHFWEHYAFTRDLEYLRKTAYPYMKQVALFWEHRLKELPDGRLVVPEGWSPEHGPREDGVSHDQQIVWDLFQNTIQASKALDVDEAFRARLTEKKKRLVGPQVGRWGQLQEWMEDRDDPNNNHRHTSHLFAVYPGRQISPVTTPEFARAAAVSLRARGETGDARRSWTWPWRCAIWARLGNAEMAHHMVAGLIRYNLLPNMIATHPPLQLDGSFGITAGMCEMLLQSHAGRIELLPALPTAWSTGSVQGLCARGGYEVDIAWREGELTSARVRSRVGGDVVLQYGGKTIEISLPAGGERRVVAEAFEADASGEKPKNAAKEAAPRPSQRRDRRLGKLRSTDDSVFPMRPVASAEAWPARRAAIRTRILVAAGLHPMPKLTSLSAVIHGKAQRDDYTVERVIFETFPEHFVTGSLYRPKSPAPNDGLRPAVLSPHGHWKNGRFHDHGLEVVRKEIEAGAEVFEVGGRHVIQARCVQLARMGCIAFVYDMEGFADSVQLDHAAGPRPEDSDGAGYLFFSPQAELHGQTPFGLQTWNSIRAVDFLCSLDDVDTSRIAVTGASGGGTQAMILGAIDERIAASMPAVMVSSAKQGGCTCENAAYLRIGQGNVDIAAATAPRPLGLICADDWTRALETNGHADLQKLYQLLGHPDRYEGHFHFEFGHNYNAVNRRHMYHFVNRRLKLGLPEPIVERDYVPLNVETEATVWTDQQTKPSGDNVGRSHERRLTAEWTKATAAALAKMAPEERLRVISDGLATMIGRRPEEVGALKWIARSNRDGDDDQREDGVLAIIDHGERLPVTLFYPKQAWNGGFTIWLSDSGKTGVLGEAGEPLAEVADVLRGGSAVAAVDLFGQGEFVSDGDALQAVRVIPRGKDDRPSQRAACYHFGYNPPLIVQRVHDVMSLVEFLRRGNGERNAKHIRLLARGTQVGPVGLLARCVLGDRIDDATIDPGGFTFEAVDRIDHPMFLPGILRYGGMGALRRLAETSLSSP